jgi:pyruvate dehydrogenase E2 component (dihydrolipoamide acetyltransferase)
MAISVEVPKLGNTVEECIVARWLKHKGDSVSEGDVVAEIETDKATFEVAAPASGILLETFFEEGALAPVFTRLFVIGEPGETVTKADSPVRAADETAGSTNGNPSLMAPAMAPAIALAPALQSRGREGAISPRARRFAKERNFYPERVNGSGPGGRILERDLSSLYESAAIVPSSTAIVPSPAASIPSLGARVSSIREKIARRMRESLASTAQYTMHASAGAGGLLALRSRLPREININHLVTFCTVETLLEIPSLNAEFRDGRIVTHAHVNLGFACDTPRGLLVPVVRSAETLYIDELAARMKDLAALAVSGHIAADDLAGATFTISNLGNLGIEAFTPLLNPPQVAILGIGAIQLKPVRRNGSIEFADAIGLSLTCDHQVIDGAPGARFLQVLKRNIENVESLCAIH